MKKAGITSPYSLQYEEGDDDDVKSESLLEAVKHEPQFEEGSYDEDESKEVDQEHSSTVPQSEESTHKTSHQVPPLSTEPSAQIDQASKPIHISADPINKVTSRWYAEGI